MSLMIAPLDLSFRQFCSKQNLQVFVYISVVATKKIGFINDIAEKQKSKLIYIVIDEL